MRNIVSRQSFASAIVASAVFAAFSAGQAAQLQIGATGSAYAMLESLDQSGFGDAIAFTPSGYTPPGIVNLVRQPLASQNQAGFGSEITFVASGYTPPGITDPSTIKVVVAR